MRYRIRQQPRGFRQLLILSIALKIHKWILTTILFALWYFRMIILFLRFNLILQFQASHFLQGT